MSKKYILIVLFFLIKLKKANSTNKTDYKFGSNCLIHNQEFKYEYLYTSNDLDIEHIFKKNIYTRLLSKVDDFNKIRWSLIKSSNESFEYFIKSSYYNEVLCASNRFSYIFSVRRYVKREYIKNYKEIPKNCRWIIKKDLTSKKFDDVYTISNVYYRNEHLYVASFFFKKTFYSRRIFLWNIKTQNISSNKFRWQIDCNNGHFLWI